jgi:HSP20 family molecular chaperone IbpA|tara:strand:+ start:43 stop:477 length:435 start_codon:yes stop_codon:yes gene_type:complete
MSELMKFNAANINQLMDRIHRNSIGMDDYFDRIFTLHETTSNYPPYNLVSVDNVTSRLEIALAGFKKKEVYVYTQDGKLFIEGQKEDKETETNYVHKGLAQRSFTRAWTLSEDTEVGSVTFEDGLLSVELGKIVPEAHKRKDYL